MSSYEADARFLQALILRRIDPLSDGVTARLVVLRAKYLAAHDGGMLDLIRRAWDAHREASKRAMVDADRTYLIGLVEGTEELLSGQTFPKLQPMFARYEEGSEMFALLIKVADLFGDAVQELACWALAGAVIDSARNGEGNDGQWQ